MKKSSLLLWNYKIKEGLSHLTSCAVCLNQSLLFGRCLTDGQENDVYFIKLGWINSSVCLPLGFLQLTSEQLWNDQQNISKAPENPCWRAVVAPAEEPPQRRDQLVIVQGIGTLLETEKVSYERFNSAHRTNISHFGPLRTLHSLGWIFHHFKQFLSFSK